MDFETIAQIVGFVVAMYVMYISFTRDDKEDDS